ncbi:hypothetical protein B0T21DRAFT_174160 [Apiosordaria backusii]|uniref:Uncharacterized protein n=1 Tax=Apiosordaria backusii TaxID=314023 RepID=A0AA40EF50_9PEZI|nr:hypothetical protein B0T21DRAFT_174160 [Apiosordaria backusii]
MYLLEVVITKMLRNAGISLDQLRADCELMVRITAAKQFQPQGPLTPDQVGFNQDSSRKAKQPLTNWTGKHHVVPREMIDLTDESTMKRPEKPVVDLTGELTIDLTNDDEPSGSDTAQVQIQDLEGLVTCLNDRQIRDLVIELAFDPATAALIYYRLWAGTRGWMALGSRGLAVAPYMITRKVVSVSASCRTSHQVSRPAWPFITIPQKKSNHVPKSVKSGRVCRSAPARSNSAKPRCQNNDRSDPTLGNEKPAQDNKIDVMEEIWGHAMARPPKK